MKFAVRLRNLRPGCNWHSSSTAAGRMSDRTIHRLPVFFIVVLTLAAGAVRAHAAERLCDPSFQNCRDGAGNLLDLIGKEQQGIDVAFWFMEDNRYATAIINRWKAGVPVRLIVDPRANSSYPLNVGNLQSFQNAGIPMIKKTGGGIMHWKTMIFAGQNTVEFGSANYSPNAFVPDAPYTNYVSETIFFSDDPAVVNSFMRKYDDLWTDTTNYSVYANVSGTRVRTYSAALTISPDLNFPPGQSFANRVIALEKAETQQIDVHMYRITEQSHSDALIAAHQRGVPIRYIGETREYRALDPNSHLPTRIWVSWNMDRMYAAGIPMRVRALANDAGEYHEKLVLLHGQATSVFGSSNFTSPSDNSQQEHNYFTKKSYVFQWFDDQFNRMWNNSHGEVETKDFVPLPPDAPSYRSIASGATGVPTTGQKLVWFGGFWAHYYDVYFGTTPPTASSTPLAANLWLGPSQTTSQTQSFTLPTLQPGTTYYWQIVSKTAAYPRAGSAVSRAGPVWSFTTAGSGGGGGGGGSSLPPGWSESDIGAVGIAGSTQYSSGTFSINASGSDIWGSADSFHYVFETLNGDGSIVARVSGVTNTNAWAKAGVMIRASVAANSAQALMLLSAGNGASFQRRTATGNTSVATTDSTATAPRWVRLDRSGNTVTAFQSSNGTSWTQVGSDTITLPQSPLVGIAVTSHNNSALTTATVDNVTVSTGGGGGGGGGGGSLPSGWSDGDIGSVGPAGSAQFANGTFTIQASGADIWGSADAFHYAYQSSFSGDGSIVARVASLTNTNAWAKAGVMFRASTAANSAHAFMLLSAGNGVSFIRRTAAGNTSVSTGVAGIAAPRYVRLDRSGNTFTAYQSSDGTAWTQVGSPETISMPSSLLVGLAVTSHNNTTLTTATFDNVSISNGSGGGGGGGGTLPPPLAERDIGSVGPAGSAQFANGTFTVKASGTDIWGTSDAFHYVYQQLVDNGEIRARVASVANTNAWAKAGVMFRSALDPSAAHAFMLVSAASGVSFIRRTAPGNTSVSTTMSGIAAPRWVRIVRSGNTLTGYESSDGSAWNVVGTDTISMSSTVYVGLAVTSHNNTTLTTAMVDNVAVSGGNGSWDY